MLTVAGMKSCGLRGVIVSHLTSMIRDEIQHNKLTCNGL